MNDNVHHLPWPAGAALPARDDRDWVTALELVDEASVTYRKVDYWTRAQLLEPIENPTPGSGHLRRYHQSQVTRCCVIRDLLNLGITSNVCRLIVDDLITDGYATVGAITIHRPTSGDAA